MARPPLPTGTLGDIRFERSRSGKSWRARAKVRDWDGVTRHVEATDKTRASAADRLKVAVRDRLRIDGAAGEISPTTRVELLAEEWHRRLLADENIARTTADQYRRILDRFTIPKLGRLQVQELTPGCLDRHQEGIARMHGASVARLNRTVLSGICGLATRRGALASNPVRDLGAIRSDRRSGKPATSLAAESARQLRCFLTYDDRAIARDLPDIVAFMLATSVRIGECLALRWGCVDLEAGSVQIAGNVIRVKGAGLMVNEYEGNKLKHRMLILPTWAAEMLSNRWKVRTSDDYVFPGLKGDGKLRDPSNTQADLREAFAFAGVEITSHVFRKTVATLMDDDGRPVRQQADQLGHSKVSMTHDHYQGRKTTETGAAKVLEVLAI